MIPQGGDACYHHVVAPMIVYIIPITALLLSFMALLASMRFIFSRQGLYWVFPAIISLLMFFQDLAILLSLGEANITTFEYTFANFSPFVMAFLWYMMVVVFHYALKKNAEENRFEIESRRNRKEAEYLEKFEMRKGRRERRIAEKRAASQASIPSIPEYEAPPDDD